ncbi:hypothetical protein D3C76_1347290 [compost metagenome]
MCTALAGHLPDAHVGQAVQAFAAHGKTLLGLRPVTACRAEQYQAVDPLRVGLGERGGSQRPQGMAHQHTALDA